MYLLDSVNNYHHFSHLTIAKRKLRKFYDKIFNFVEIKSSNFDQFD